MAPRKKVKTVNKVKKRGVQKKVKPTKGAGATRKNKRKAAAELYKIEGRANVKKHKAARKSGKKKGALGEAIKGAKGALKGAKSMLKQGKKIAQGAKKRVQSSPRPTTKKTKSGFGVRKYVPTHKRETEAHKRAKRQGYKVTRRSGRNKK